MTIEVLMVVAALALLLSIVASKVSARLGIPALLLFLALGMLAGSDGPGQIYFDDARLSQAIGVVALSYILFYGGLGTRIDTIRPVMVSGIIVSTLGVLITAGVVALAAQGWLGFTLLEGLLIGGIVASTDAAAVFSVLRARGSQLKPRVNALLELESGSNDPMAVFLTLGAIQLLTIPEQSAVDLLPFFVQQMGIGALLGYAAGRLLPLFINRIQLEYDGLYPVLTLMSVLIIYGATTLVGGNGFLAVYLAGVLLGNRDFLHKNSLTQFHDGIAWLMQIAMFLTLGLLVFPSQLLPVAASGLLLSAVLIFAARPLAVFISLAFANFTFREKLLISWVGLRGAAPIVLATFPLLAQVEKANAIFNLVFFIVLTSVLLQGTTLQRVARWLGVTSPLVKEPGFPLMYVPGSDMRGQLIEMVVPPYCAVEGRQIVELDLPNETLIVLIGRDRTYLTPRGSTIIQPGDRLLMLSSPEALEQTKSIINGDYLREATP
ncbi:MAG: potassium/proton antiporter [Chloroflexota bacterium]|nr:potassium/proton antiporter [Chloroflexota bacterium]